MVGAYILQIWLECTVIGIIGDKIRSTKKKIIDVELVVFLRNSSIAKCELESWPSRVTVMKLSERDLSIQGQNWSGRS